MDQNEKNQAPVRTETDTADLSEDSLELVAGGLLIEEPLDYKFMAMADNRNHHVDMKCFLGCEKPGSGKVFGAMYAREYKPGYWYTDVKCYNCGMMYYQLHIAI